MPEHVQVKNGSGKAKFDISDGVQLVESKGMKIPELKRAQEIAEEEVLLLKEKWHEFFDMVVTAGCTEDVLKDIRENPEVAREYCRIKEGVK